MKTAFCMALLATLALALIGPALAEQTTPAELLPGEDDAAIFAIQRDQNPWDDTRSSGGPSTGGGSPAVVPEPGTMVLLGLGLAALGASRRRRNRQS